jgi:transposase-like protein
VRAQIQSWSPASVPYLLGIAAGKSCCACCDGLTGLPDAIRVVFPDTVVQTCVVHVIRNAMRFVSYGDRKKVVKAMQEIYTAPTLEAAGSVVVVAESG